MTEQTSDRPPSQQPTRPLPFVQLDFFLRQYAPAGQRYFWLLYGALVLAVILLLITYYTPFHWSLETGTDSYFSLRKQPFEQIQKDYLEVSNNVLIALGFSRYEAGLLRPATGLLIPFGLLMMLGLSALLAASTSMKEYWSYPLWLLIAAYLVEAHLPQVFGAGPEVSRLYGLPAALLLLVPAWLIKRGTWQLTMLAQTGLFFGLFLLLGISGAIAGGWAGLHLLTVGPIRIQLILAAAFAVLSAKELLNLVIYLGTNRRDPRSRLRLRGMILLVAMVLVLLLVLALQYNGLLATEPFLVLPIHLFAALALLSIFLVQNAYFQVQDILPKHLAFSSLILGLGITAVAFLGYHFGNAEVIFRYEVERSLITLFFLAAFLQSIYLFMNFSGLMKRGLNFYYILYKPERVRFFGVWLLLFTFFALWETVQQPSWQSYKATQALHRNQIADQALLQDQDSLAIKAYQASYAKVFGQVKTGYNLGMLLSGQADYSDLPAKKRRLIGEYFIDAEHRFSFPPARLNLKRFLAGIERPQEALNYLKRVDSLYPDHRSQNAIADLYYQQTEPDSAILWLRKAIRNAPGEALLYNNLGTIYAFYEHPDWARRFVREAYELAPDFQPVLLNAYAMRLDSAAADQHPLDLQTPADSSSNARRGFNLNRALYAYRRGEHTYADSIVARMLYRSASLEAMTARLYTAGGVDSLENVLSVISYIESNHEDLAGEANHNAATVFFRKDLPGMASLHFLKAAKFGNQASRIPAGYMEALRGNHPDARLIFENFLADYNDAYGPAPQHELAMLDKAAGVPDFLLPWKFENIQTNEVLRLGRYAGQTGNWPVADDMLSKLMTARPKDIRAYLQYAESARMQDSLPLLDKARKLLLKAKEVDTTGSALPQITIARTYLAEEAYVKAEASLEDADSTGPHALDYQLVQGEILLGNEQYEQALAHYRQLNQAHPYHTEVVMGYGRALKALEKWDKGYLVLGEALFDRDRRAPLLAQYATFAEQMGFPDEAAAALDKAIEFAIRSSNKATYKARRAELDVSGMVESGASFDASQLKEGQVMDNETLPGDSL